MQAGCKMQRSRMLLLGRERELVAQLHELLFPSPAPCGGGGASWSSSSGLNVAECPSDESSLVSCGGRRRRRPGGKRVREDEEEHQHEGQEQHGGGASVKTRCRRKKKKQGTSSTTLMVTTVPDFDGYQWRKYGQKQIEAAQYPRSYYRCTNSMDQGCPAKRTVQRNDDGDDNGGEPPKYMVVYISEHTCKATEPVPPVILETTVVRTKNPAADHDAAAHVTPAAAAPDAIGVAPLFAESPAISDITWSGDVNPSLSEHGYCSLVFAVDDYWDRTTAAPAAAAVLQEMDFAGPIRSPVHIAADGWIDGLFVNEPSVLNSCHLFGF